jgi:cation diffusion facilitator CzcD-associated flavoprotein CzcO
VDIESVHYSFSFDEELQQEWHWTEKFAAQPEILRYLNHCADRFDIRRSVQFDTRIVDVAWDEENSYWVATDDKGVRRRRVYEDRWNRGGFRLFIDSFTDILFDKSNWSDRRRRVLSL